MNEKELVNAVVRNDFSKFLLAVFPIVCPNEIYVPAPYIDLLANRLTSLPYSDARRLIVNIPPRHLKSTIISVALPAWLLGHNPSVKILCVSYSAELAIPLSTQTRQIMESARYKELFPGTAMSASGNTQELITTTANGYRKAVSIEGGITGFGGDYIIVDDPQKAIDVHYETKRQHAVQVLKNTVLTRLNNEASGCVILVQQRLHEDDCSGTMLSTGAWDHLNLPAIAEMDESIAYGNQMFVRKVGDVLNPKRTSRQDLDKKRAELGEAEFSAQFQQRPLPGGGGILALSAFPRYQGKITKKPGDIIVHSWDVAYTTEKHSDYSVLSVWVYRDYCLYLAHIVKRKANTLQLKQLIFEYSKKADYVVIEDSAQGRGLYEELFQTHHGKFFVDIPRDSKEVRLMKVQHLIETERVWLPTEAPWLPDFLHELLAFPHGKHDDQVDSFVQALRWMHCRTHKPPFDWHAPKSEEQACIAQG